MKTHRTVPLLAALLAVCATTTVGNAQGAKKISRTPAAPVQPAAAATKDSAETISSADAPPAPEASETEMVDTVHKKHGGLMGKMKGVAKNKIVRQVAKVALCTAVPGGQFVAGAIDAAESKNVTGAAGAAAGAATGSNCMPGVGGMGMRPGGANAAGANAAAAAGNAPAAQAMTAGAMGAGNTQAIAAMAAMQAQMIQAQMSQAQMAQMQAGQMPSGMPAGMPGGMPGAMGMPGEGGGKRIELSADLVGELTKGKTIIRNIDWSPGTGAVSPAGSDGFASAMAQVAAAMQTAGGRYRLDLYMDPRSGDAVVRTLGPQRLSTVQAVLVPGGVAANPAAVPQIGKTKKDKDPRLEIVKAK